MYASYIIVKKIGSLKSKNEKKKKMKNGIKFSITMEHSSLTALDTNIILVYTLSYEIIYLTLLQCVAKTRCAKHAYVDYIHLDAYLGADTLNTQLITLYTIKNVFSFPFVLLFFRLCKE